MDAKHNTKSQENPEQTAAILVRLPRSKKILIEERARAEYRSLNQHLQKLIDDDIAEGANLEAAA